MEEDRSKYYAVIASRAIQELREATTGTSDSVLMTNEAISGLKQTIEDLQNEVNFLYQENELLRQQNNGTYSAESENFNSSSSQFNKIEEQWNNQYKQLELEKIDLEEKYKRLELQIKDYRDVNDTVGQLESEITTLSQKNNDLVKQYEDREEEYQNYVNELDSQMKKLVADNKQKDDQLDILKSQIDELQNNDRSFESLNRIIQDNTKLKQQINELERRYESVLSERDEANEKTKQLLEEIQINKEGISEMNTLQSQIRNLTHINNQYQEREQEFENERKEVRAAMIQMEREKALETKKSLEYEIQINNLQKEIDYYKTEIERVNKEQQQKQEEVATQQNQTQTNNNVSEQNNIDYSDLIAENERLTNENKKLLEENNSLSQINHMKSDALETQRNDYEKQIQQKIEEISERNIQIEIKESQVRKLRSQLDDLISYSNAIEQQAKDKNAIQEDLEKRLKEVENDFNESVKKNVQLSKEYTNFKESVCSLLGVTNPNDAIKKLNENLSRMVELLQLSENTIQIQSNYETMKLQYKNLEGKFRTIEEQLTHERQKTSAVARGQSDNAIKTIQQENARLLQEKTAMEKELDSLNEQIINLDAENKRLKIDVDKASRKQQIATNKSERLSFFESSHNEALNFVQSLSTEINQRLDPSTSNVNRIKVLDYLAGQLESQFSTEEQISQGWNNLKDLLLDEFQTPDLYTIQSIINTRAQASFDMFTEQIEKMQEGLQSASMSIDMFYRTHRMKTPRSRKAPFDPDNTPLSTARQNLSFVRTPTSTITPTRLSTDTYRKSPTQILNRSRPHLAPRSFTGEKPSARVPFNE